MDIVDAWLDFHLNAGVDFVIATDNLSQDGTTEISSATPARARSTSSASRVRTCARTSG